MGILGATDAFAGAGGFAGPSALAGSSNVVIGGDVGASSSAGCDDGISSGGASAVVGSGPDIHVVDGSASGLEVAAGSLSTHSQPPNQVTITVFEARHLLGMNRNQTRCQCAAGFCVKSDNRSLVCTTL